MNTDPGGWKYYVDIKMIDGKVDHFDFDKINIRNGHHDHMTFHIHDPEGFYHRNGPTFGGAGIVHNTLGFIEQHDGREVEKAFYDKLWNVANELWNARTERGKPDLYEVGFATDEATFFCRAESEAKAREIFINVKRNMLDDAEEPGWENHVWAINRETRVLK